MKDPAQRLPRVEALAREPAGSRRASDYTCGRIAPQRLIAGHLASDTIRGAPAARPQSGCRDGLSGLLGPGRRLVVAGVTRLGDRPDTAIDVRLGNRPPGRRPRAGCRRRAHRNAAPRRFARPRERAADGHHGWPAALVGRRTGPARGPVSTPGCAHDPHRLVAPLAALCASIGARSTSRRPAAPRPTSSTCVRTS